MDRSRRNFLGAIIPAAWAAAAALANAQNPPQGQPEQRGPGFPREDEHSKIDPRLVLKHNQVQIKSDVEKLFALAEELKTEMKKTDSSEVLSLPLVHKAEEIEKLAKHIKDLARG